jgi:hypothetical protein
LNDHLALPVEQASLPAARDIFIRLMTAGITIAHADDMRIARDGKVQQIGCIGDFQPLLVHYRDIEYGRIPAISSQ